MITKRIKKKSITIRIFRNVRRSKEKSEVSINYECQSIDIKKQGGKEFIRYFFEDISFEVITYRYNSWKAKRGNVSNIEELFDFLDGIATTQNALQYWNIGSWKPNGIFWGFKTEEIKTTEEWYLVGKLSQQEKKKIIACENQKADWVRWNGIKISGKNYYLLGELEFIKYLSETETQIEVPPKTNS